MATGTISPFTPIATATIAASTTAAGATVPGADSMLVFNSTAATAFLATSGTASPTNGTPIPAGARQLFGGSPLGLTVSVVLASGTGSVFVTAGNGTGY
jgi:hypothetical protein